MVVVFSSRPWQKQVWHGTFPSLLREMNCNWWHGYSSLLSCRDVTKAWDERTWQYDITKCMCSRLDVPRGWFRLHWSAGALATTGIIGIARLLLRVYVFVLLLIDCYVVLTHLCQDGFHCCFTSCFKWQYCFYSFSRITFPCTHSPCWIITASYNPLLVLYQMGAP